MTGAATPTEATAGAVGWLPAGRGLLIETIKVSPDGNAFTSKIRYELFDHVGKPVEIGGTGGARAVRMTFN